MNISNFKMGTFVRYNRTAYDVLRGWGLEQQIDSVGKVIAVTDDEDGDEEPHLIVEWAFGQEIRKIHPVHLEPINREELCQDVLTK